MLLRVRFCRVVCRFCIAVCNFGVLFPCVWLCGVLFCAGLVTTLLSCPGVRVQSLVVAVPALGGRVPTATRSHILRQLSLRFVFHTVQPTVAPGVPRRSPSPPCLPRLPTRWRPGREPGLPSPSPRFGAPQGCVEHLLPEATGFHPLSLALRFEEHIFPGFLRTVAGR